jgi:nitrogen fixation NifU-like protein
MTETDSLDDLQDLYQQVILDHGRKPRHAQRLSAFDATAMGDNPMCGDRIQVWIQLDAERIANVGFEARGCAISVASADLMVEAVQGRSPATAKALFDVFRSTVRTGICPDCAPELAEPIQRLAPLSGVHDYPSRVKCATLPWHALIAALDGAKETSSE